MQPPWFPLVVVAHTVGFAHRGAVIGRSLPLWLSDLKFGPLNTMILMMTATLFVVLAIWLPFGTSSVTVLFVIAVLLGIGTGSSVPLGGKNLKSLFPGKVRCVANI